MEKIKTLDGLRGIAVLMVLLWHLPFINGFEFFKIISSKLRFDYLGVDTFFILSGFLITRILINEKKADIYSFKRFYLKRALRIFPIYYLTIIVSGLLFSFKDVWPAAIFISNYVDTAGPLSHTWSIAVEEHFYILWPLLIYKLDLLKAEKIIKYAIPVITIAAAGLTLIFFDNSYMLIYKGTLCRILSLSIGASFAFKESDVRRLPSWYIYLFALLAIALFTAYYFINLTYFSNSKSKALVGMLLLTPVSSFIFLIALLMNNSSNKLSVIFSNAPLRFIGKISYGIYLYHVPILFFFGMLPTQVTVEPSAFVLPLILLFGIPIISYYLVERYFLGLKKYLSPKYYPLSN